MLAFAGAPSESSIRPNGMNLLDSSLAELVKAGTITREEALKVCEDPKLVA